MIDNAFNKYFFRKNGSNDQFWPQTSSVPFANSSFNISLEKTQYAPVVFNI